MANTWLDIWTGIWSDYWGVEAPTLFDTDSTYYNVQVEIYDDTALQTMQDVINARMSPTALEELKAHGGGGFRVSKYDPKVRANPSLLEYRKYVKIRQNGKVIGGFIIQNKKSNIVGAGEESEEVWEVSGEGPRSWVRDAAVYPSKGLKSGSADTRYFNFSTEQGSWYTASQWKNPIVTWNWNQANNWYGTAPADWPNAPAAKWVWDRSGPYAMPQGFVYFRYEFTAVAGAYSWFFAVDDQAEVYLDGELLITTAEHSWQNTTRLDFDIETPGPHVLGVKAYNYKSEGPGALLGALFRVGDPNVPTSASLINTTGQSGWKVMGYPAEEPGWTAGDVLVTLMNEAKARGVRFANNITLSFTADLDSAGQPWGTPVPWSFSVGASYEEVINAVEELGADVYVHPDTLVMYAWKKRGVDRSITGGSQNPVILRPGHNLVSASESGQAQIANTVLLHASDGWKEEVVSPVESASVAKYGRVETQLATQLSQSGATPLIKELFRQKALPEVSATFELIPVEGMIPFQDFNVGDYVSAPGDVPGVMETRRVMSIAFTEDEDTGRPVFAIEFDTIFKDRQAELEKWVSRLSGSSSIGGGFANSGALPPTSVQLPPGPVLVSVPDAPTGLVVGSVGFWTEGGGASSDYSLEWNAVITGAGYGTVEVESYEVWGRLISETEPQLIARVFDTNAYLPGFRPGDEWAFKVRAVERTGGPGPFSPEVSLVAFQPATPLSAPSAPQLSTARGGVTIKWDGLLGGEPAPGYLRYVRVMRTGTGSTGTWMEKRRNLFTNPYATSLTGFSSTGGATVTLSLRSDMPGTPNTAVRATRTGTGNARLVDVVVGTTMLANTKYRTRLKVRSSEALTDVYVYYRPAVAVPSTQVEADRINLPAGVSYVDVTANTAAGAPTSTAGVTIITANGSVNSTIDVTEILVEKAPSDGTLIAGDLTSENPNIRYRWLGTANNSVSVMEELDPWVQVGTIINGQTQDASTVAGKTYDYRLVPVDPYGVEGPASPSSTITVEGIQNGDITGGMASLNLLPNGSFEEGFEGWEIRTVYLGGGSAAEVLEGGLAGAKYLRMTRGVEIPGSETTLSVGQEREQFIPISSVGSYGYFISAKVAGLADYPEGFSMFAYWFQGDRVTPASLESSGAVDQMDVGTTAQYAVGQVFPPDDARFMQVVLVNNASNSAIYVDDVVVREVINTAMLGKDSVTGEVISGGTITGNHIQGETIEGRHVIFESLTGDHIAAFSITANKLSSDVGASLDLSSNTAVNILITRQDTLEGDVAETQAGLTDLQTYYSFTGEGAIIGKTDSSFKLFLKNDRIEILQDGVAVSWWDSGQMVVPKFVGVEVVLANHKFETYGSGTVVKRI